VDHLSPCLSPGRPRRPAGSRTSRRARRPPSRRRRRSCSPPPSRP